MPELTITFLDFVWLVIVIAVSLICFGISVYSVSRRERETQFHELWFIADGKRALAKKTTEFEA